MDPDATVTSSARQGGGRHGDGAATVTVDLPPTQNCTWPHPADAEDVLAAIAAVARARCLRAAAAGPAGAARLHAATGATCRCTPAAASGPRPVRPHAPLRKGPAPVIRADAEQLPFASSTLPAVITVMAQSDMPVIPPCSLRPRGCCGRAECSCTGFVTNPTTAHPARAPQRRSCGPYVLLTACYSAPG